MENLELKIDILILKIGAIRSRVKMLEIALSTYRTIKEIQFERKENTLIEKVRETDRKIAETINRINSSLKLLSSLETELFALQGDDSSGL